MESGKTVKETVDFDENFNMFVEFSSEQQSNNSKKPKKKAAR